MIGIWLLGLTVIGLIVAVIGGIVYKVNSDSEGAMGTMVVGIIMFLLFGILFGLRCFTVIDAGETGVQVMFGKVLDKTLTEGLSSKNPFASVDKYNIQLRETTMDIKDGNHLQALTADKLAVKIEATIWWKIIKEDVKMIRREISDDADDIADMITFPSIRSAVRDASVYYTFEEITSVKGRTELTAKIDEILIRLTKGKGVVIDNVLIRNVVPEDKRVTQAIGRKLEQQQQLQAKEYELSKAQMDAKIRIQNAEGIASAQHIIDKTLTPEYLQFEAIQMMKEVAHSPNSTFVFVPTHQGEIGMPMVYSLKDFQKTKK
ncbi:MAG: prohibitin family protein [Patescibacteria group bacterium]|jgi:regulator of protease activity HflC (stomatin/prohibitin superfamily)